MRAQKICFSNQPVLWVFSGERSNLAQANSELRLEGNYPVIVLIGGEIDEQHTIRAVDELVFAGFLHGAPLAQK